MAGEIQVNSVTALTESGNNIILNNVDTATNRTNLGLGSMSTQASGSIDIDGGTIDGTTIGGASAAAGTFTTITGTFNGTIGDSAVLSDSYYLHATVDGNFSSALPRNINFDESTSPYWVFTSDSDWHVSGTGSNFSKGTTDADLKIHRAGIYLVNFSASGSESSGERAFEVSIRGVGSGSSTNLSRSLDNIAITDGSTNYGSASASLIYKFNANDQINFHISSSSGNTADISAASHFNICLIRPL